MKQRKTIPIKEHNKLIRKYEKLSIKQLTAIAAIENRVLDSEQKLKTLEVQYNNEIEHSKEERDFLNSRIAVLYQTLDIREREIENLREVISSLGRNIISNQIKIYDLKQEKYINSQTLAYETVNNYLTGENKK